jgi:hypothetical protein
MLVNTAKVGSSVNYFIEWMCVWSVLIGILACSALDLIQRAELDIKPFQLAAAIGLPAIMIYQVLLVPRSYIAPVDAMTGQKMGQLLDTIHESSKPILSDDMVLLLKAGKEVPVEPAIFTELTYTGLWAEQRMIDMIKSGFFEFVVSKETRLDSECYTPSIRAAIKSAYPRIVEYGSYRVYRPSS